MARMALVCTLALAGQAFHSVWAGDLPAPVKVGARRSELGSSIRFLSSLGGLWSPNVDNWARPGVIVLARLLSTGYWRQFQQYLRSATAFAAV
jgi:hypothetical protein